MPVTDWFAERASDFVRAMVADAGSVSDAALFSGISRTTLSDIYLGRTETPSALTIERLSAAFDALPTEQRWHIQAGIDLMTGLDLQSKVDLVRAAWAAPEGWRETIGDVQRSWIERREEIVRAGQEPPEVPSP